MTSNHIVKSFDEQLRRLDNLIAEMGGLAEVQLSEAIEAMVRRDVDRAQGLSGHPPRRATGE